MQGCACMGLSYGYDGAMGSNRTQGGGGKAVCFIRWEEAGPLHAVRQVGLTGGIQQRWSCLSAEGRPQGSVKGRRRQALHLRHRWALWAEEPHSASAHAMRGAGNGVETALQDASEESSVWEEEELEARGGH